MKESDIPKNLDGLMFEYAYDYSTYTSSPENSISDGGRDMYDTGNQVRHYQYKVSLGNVLVDYMQLSSLRNQYADQ